MKKTLPLIVDKKDEEPTADLLKVLALLIQLEDDIQHSIKAAKVEVPKTKETLPLIAAEKDDEPAATLVKVLLLAST